LNYISYAKWTRCSAVAVIASHTVYDVWYSYRLLSGISVVSMSISYLHFQTVVSEVLPVSFLADCCVLWLNDTSYRKSVWRSE